MHDMLTGGKNANVLTCNFFVRSWKDWWEKCYPIAFSSKQETLAKVRWQKPHACKLTRNIKLDADRSFIDKINIDYNGKLTSIVLSIHKHLTKILVKKIGGRSHMLVFYIWKTLIHISSDPTYPVMGQKPINVEVKKKPNFFLKLTSYGSPLIKNVIKISVK